MKGILYATGFVSILLSLGMPIDSFATESFEYSVINNSNGAIRVSIKNGSVGDEILIETGGCRILSADRYNSDYSLEVCATVESENNFLGCGQKNDGGTIVFRRNGPPTMIISSNCRDINDEILLSYGIDPLLRNSW